LLFLGEIKKYIFVGGTGITMHVTPCQTASVNFFQNRKSLYSAFPKFQNICIINKTNTSSRKVRRIANVNKISIVKEDKNRRERKALGNAFLRQQKRRGEPRKTQTSLSVRKK
jgi:hypothetical protein